MKAFLKYQGKTSPKLRKAVIAGLSDIESLVDVANHGASGGYGQFCYYSDTVAFYKKNKKDILSAAVQDASDVGLSVSEVISGFNCLKSHRLTCADVDSILFETEPDSDIQTQVFNALTWYALESVAYDYHSFKESN
jgi:hypothetical protein